MRVHLYSGPNPRPGNIIGLGSVSLVAAVQAGAVSVHMLDRFGQVGLPKAVVLRLKVAKSFRNILARRMLAMLSL